MRCKVGDIAYIVAANPGGRHHIGRVVTVVRPYICDSWICHPELFRTDGFPAAWIDDHLRPIRDPGGEAKDEMLRPLPVEDLDIAHA